MPSSLSICILGGGHGPQEIGGRALLLIPPSLGQLGQVGWFWQGQWEDRHRGSWGRVCKEFGVMLTGQALQGIGMPAVGVWPQGWSCLHFSGPGQSHLTGIALRTFRVFLCTSADP